ncbi:ester cyclase [Variovorax sp.]|jgi:predicted SnoaL-like aldol condensation-catalyzing enzyme|uniref:nuclear transport factor 2 family protein n=1 Tax=Variovorax sp. TaxID=1871043 RepID=UPI0037DA3E11
MQRTTLNALTVAVALVLSACAPIDGGKRRSITQQEANRQAVLAFYEKGLNQKDAEAALAYVGSRYVQHNPLVADGPEGFRKVIAFVREKFPNAHSEIKRSFGDGDYVILHVHAVSEPGTRGTAIVDIFKLENGKIVEHWDVIQPVPETAANSNGMF